MSEAPIGILGGTFNPIHNGHLRSALEIRERLDLAELRLVPAAVPPHRPTPTLPAEVRADLVELALSGAEGLRCDRRELLRSGPSYTFDTLNELRSELGAERSLCLVMGVDALAGLHSWHRWKELLSLAHMIVIARPGYALPDEGEVADFLEANPPQKADALRHNPCGAVVVERLTPLEISATAIRGLVGAGRSPRYLVPEPVCEAILERGLYRDKPSNPE